MAIALKRTATGQLQQVEVGDSLEVDSLERRAGSGNLVVGSGLGAAEELQLASVASLVRVEGDFVVDGQVDAALDMGGNAINNQEWTELSPTALAAQADNYDPTSFGTAHVVRQDLTGSQTITGFSAPAGTDNRRFIVVNIDGASDVLTLAHEDASSTATNRILCPGGTNLTLNPGFSALLDYDVTSSRWRVLGVAGSGSGGVTGPVSSTDNAIVRWDGTGGGTLQDSGITIDDSDNISGVTTVLFSSEVDNGNTGASQTVTWANGQKQRSELNAATVTVTHTFPGVGNYIWKVVQDATTQCTSLTLAVTGGSALFPGGALLVAGGADEVTLVSAYYDGTNAHFTSAPDSSTGSVLIGAVTAPSFEDSVFRIVDDGDSSKEIAFQASSITTATTRTITMPDADVNLGSLVVGPASATDNAVTRFDATTGKLVQNSTVIIDDSGNVDTAGGTLNLGGAAILEQGYTDLTPTALSAQANDYDPASFGTADIVRQDLTGSQTITGFAAPGATDNSRFCIINIDGAADVLTLSDENAASTAANRIAGPNGQDIVLNSGESAILDYDATTSRWRAVAVAQATTGATTEFQDSVFRILDDGDNSKEIAFQASAITTATTRTITMPDADVNLGDLVAGPASATDNAITRFDATTGKLVQDSTVTLDDSGNIDTAGGTINLGGAAILEQGYTDLTPTALSAQADDYDPASFGTADVVRQDLTGSQTITGFAAPGATDNSRFSIVNIDGAADVLTISNENVASTAANRIAGPNGQDIVLNPGEAALLDYDTTASRWRAVAVSQVSSGTTEFQDSVFRILDDGDNSKEIAFQASAITTATTRTITMPDADVNLGSLVVGPASATDNAIVRFDATTGKLVQDSGLTINDSGDLDLEEGTILAQRRTVISPTAIAAQADDYDPTGFGTAEVVRITLTGSQSITGFAAPVAGENEHRVITNIDTTDNLTLVDESASSTAANRISGPEGEDVVIGPGESAEILYDATTSRWRVVYKSGQVHNAIAAWFNAEFSNGSVSTSATIDFAAGQKQTVTLTGNAALTIATPGVGNYLLRVVQDGTGSRVPTWTRSGGGGELAPGGTLTLSTGASDVDLVAIYDNGTDMYMTVVNDFVQI